MLKLLMGYWVAITMAATPLVQAADVELEFQAGTHYEVLAEPFPTETGDKVEVREFFWYGCSHCYQMEPYVEKWLKTKPDYAELNRSPAAFNKAWETHARAYYAMKLMGKDGELHPLFFDAVKADTKGMLKVENIAAFFSKHGIDEKTYSKLAGSIKVSAKIAMTKKIMAKAELTGVPAFLVNGRYVVKSASSRQQMLDIVSFLVEKEKKTSLAAAD